MKFRSGRPKLDEIGTGSTRAPRRAPNPTQNVMSRTPIFAQHSKTVSGSDAGLLAEAATRSRSVPSASSWTQHPRAAALPGVTNGPHPDRTDPALLFMPHDLSNPSDPKCASKPPKICCRCLRRQHTCPAPSRALRTQVQRLEIHSHPDLEAFPSPIRPTHDLASCRPFVRSVGGQVGRRPGELNNPVVEGGQAT